jgi:hypothetical protein
MSQSGSQAWAFYREVAKTRVVWAMRDGGGYPSVTTADGKRAMPFWSSRSRVERIIQSVSAYSGFQPVEIPWSDFAARWVPGLARDGILAGVNWSGPGATGYDVEPDRLRQSVQAIIENLQ